MNDKYKKGQRISIVSGAFDLILGICCYAVSVMPAIESSSTVVVVGALMFVCGILTFLSTKKPEAKGLLVLNIIACVIKFFSISSILRFIGISMMKSNENKNDYDEKVKTVGNEIENIMEVKEMKKDKKNIFFWLTTILIIVWLFLGFIGVISPSSGLLWTINDDEISNKAINIVTGYIMIASAFTYLIFLAECNQFKFSKKLKLIFISIGIGLSLIMDIVYFMVFQEQLEILAYTNQTDFIYAKLGDGTTLTIAMFVSQIALIAAGFYSRSYDKDKKTPIIVFIVYIISTFLIFVAVGVAVTLAVIAIVFIAIKIIAYLCLNSASIHNAYTITDRMGQTRTLTYYEYDSNRGVERYKDDLGYYWIKDKDSDNFYEEK